MDENAHNKNVETYVDDITQALETSQEGVIRKIIAEQSARDEEGRGRSPFSKRNRFFALGGLAAVIIAIVIIAAVSARHKAASTVPAAPQYQPLIFTDSASPLEIAGMKKDQIMAAVAGHISALAAAPGDIEGIYLTENQQMIGLHRLMALTGGGLPLADMPYMEDNFLIGAYRDPAADPSLPADPFLLLKMRSVADVFDGMRAWEHKMYYDLYGMFGRTVGSSSDPLLTADFEDGIIANKNARILRDGAGNIVLMYVYADDSSVIVTDREATAREVILRLASSQLKR